MRSSIRRAIIAHAKGVTGTLLDAGCGGRPYEPIVRPFICRYVGFDCVANDGSGPTVCGDVTALPFAERSFDAILCTEVLEHVLEPDVCVEEFCRVLRPGGRVICTVPFAFPIHDVADYRRYAFPGLRLLYEKRGFEVTALVPLCGTAETIALLLNLYLFDLGFYWKRGLYLPGLALRPFIWLITALINLAGGFAHRCVRSYHLPVGYLIVAVRPAEDRPS